MFSLFLTRPSILRLLYFLHPLLLCIVVKDQFVFPTCQVRVVRLCQLVPCSSCSSSSSASSSTASLGWQCSRPYLNYEGRMAASFGEQCCPPDLNQHTTTKTHVQQTTTAHNPRTHKQSREPQNPRPWQHAPHHGMKTMIEMSSRRSLEVE